MSTLGLSDVSSEPTQERPYSITLIGWAASLSIAFLLVFLLKLPKSVPLVLTGVIYIVLIGGANALGISIAGSVLQRNVDGIARRTSSIAVWFAPLAIYLRAGSIFAIPIAIIAMIRIVRMFKSSEKSRSLTQTTFKEMFQFPDPPPISDLLSLVCAAACIEATIAAGASQTVSAAALFAATGSGIIGWRLSTARPNPVSHAPREWLSSGLTLMLAFLLTMGGIGSGSGDGDLDAAQLQAGAGGAYWGVILWPEDSPKQIQLVSVPSNPALFDKGLKLRVKIPFDGVYWFFKSPEVQPPRGSITAYGTPDEIGFRSTDSTALIMEAHQNLANQLDLTCCNAFEVTVRNAESLPGTVTMEVVLMDSTQPFQAPLALGEVAVTPDRPLHFAIPERPDTPTFDAITIRFHMDASRDRVSPRIAIVDFVMVPR